MMRPPSLIGTAHHPTAEGHPRSNRRGHRTAAARATGGRSAAVGTPASFWLAEGWAYFCGGRTCPDKTAPAADLT